MIPGLLRYEADISVNEEVVLMTTKGEAIALAIAQMSTVEMTTCDHGVVAKVKRCIMERDLYPRRWGLGPTATEKKKLKADGKLDVRPYPHTLHQVSTILIQSVLQKYGRTNENTPKRWKDKYTDFNGEEGASAPTAAAANADGDVEMKTAAASEDKKEKKSKKGKDKAPDVEQQLAGESFTH